MLGAEWLYEGWSTGGSEVSNCETQCEGNYNLFRVTGEKKFAGRIHAEISRYHKTNNTDWQLTNDIIYLYDLDSEFFAHRGIYAFIQTYNTNVTVGDTIDASATQSFPKWIGDDDYTYGYPSIGGKQIVENIDTIIIDGQFRKKIESRNLQDFRIGTVIEGIGPLNFGLLGYDQTLPSSGCLPRLICYKDSLVTFIADEDCGCEVPIGPNSIPELDNISISVYPNPSNEEVWIDTPEKNQFDQIIIRDISGTEVYRQIFQPKINLSHLPQGIYFIQLSNYESKVTKRIAIY